MRLAHTFLLFLFATSGVWALPPSDLNGDGRIDSDDVLIIAGARNEPAGGPGDARDLDEDGTITLLDARILASACSTELGGPRNLCLTDPCQEVRCGTTEFGDECGVRDIPGCFPVTCDGFGSCPSDLEVQLLADNPCFEPNPQCVSSPDVTDLCIFDVRDPCFDDCDIRVADPDGTPADSDAFCQSEFDSWFATDGQNTFLHPDHSCNGPWVCFGDEPGENQVPVEGCMPGTCPDQCTPTNASVSCCEAITDCAQCEITAGCDVTAGGGAGFTCTVSPFSSETCENLGIVELP